ncbi:hypothetical protein TRFO_16824 [Tritrichomonas foetus]|uniref:LisH domain-containing protein ARMC9 n=1 Tax=Tritrichomonas foetus TaxID=1144522 RepID=A0A1J4KU20_9EUKA|nr:hypothetical protein TRFO_16824 [Tritrichomonas foetus]|eukprot:OHT13158.1 hypothetical protein TRFO_16824 [Tritrichomonas foetus]
MPLFNEQKFIQMTSEVFDAVADFLQFCGMNSTLAVFQSERLSCPPLEEIARRRTDTQAEFKRDLINSLTTGDVQRFRSLWGSKWQAAPDQAAQRLLFRCEVFFAVFPLHPANRVKFGDISESLMRFREFLDTHHQDLSQSTEFLPFYALPYIPNPADHPSFKQIFSVSWFDELKRQLTEWLDRQLVGAQMPLIVSALRSPGDSTASTDSELWSVALELADALQHAEHGDIPPHEYINSLFARIGIFPGGAVKFTATTDFSPLDFKKVTKDLENPDLAAPLLKACVNRLTRAPTEHVKRFYVELISGDVFLVSKGSLIGKLLANPGPVKSYALRVLNILATDPPGRQYIFKNKKLIELLMPMMSEDDSDDLMNTIGILQKLSLMKDAKTQLIKTGALDAALKLLADPSRLSDYTGDYAAALVMNLCMRKEAAQKCINNDALSILAELSGATSPQLQLYAIAALSELFTKEPKLREKAKSIGLPALFVQMRSSADPGIVEQFDYVVKAMNGEVEDTGDDDADDDDNGSATFDAYDEVGNGQWDFDVEGEALLAKYVITTGEASKAKEAIDTSLRMSQARMSVSFGGSKSGRRPITPGHE